MVHGLEVFKKAFKDFKHHYVLIGGSACDILMDSLGVGFRATKDLDMVLIVEELDEFFGQAFRSFIAEGGYVHKRNQSDNYQFYRFEKPRNANYPKMIELFSRKPNTLFEGVNIAPIHVDESIESLSAIVLDDSYYHFLKEQMNVIEGVTVLSTSALIVFKIKEWLNLKTDKEKGLRVDSRNIKKHRNDIFRLLSVIEPTTRIPLTGNIEEDVIDFNDLIMDTPPDLKHLGIKNTPLKDMLSLLNTIFNIKNE